MSHASRYDHQSLETAERPNREYGQKRRHVSGHTSTPRQRSQQKMSEAELVNVFLERIRQSDAVTDDLLSTVRSDSEIVGKLLESNRKLLDAIQNLRRENIALKSAGEKTPGEMRLLAQEQKKISQAIG